MEQGNLACYACTLVKYVNWNVLMPNLQVTGISVFKTIMILLFLKCGFRAEKEGVFTKNKLTTEPRTIMQ